jgi:hypothetical protein
MRGLTLMAETGIQDRRKSSAFRISVTIAATIAIINITNLKAYLDDSKVQIEVPSSKSIDVTGARAAPLSSVHTKVEAVA